MRNELQFCSDDELIAVARYIVTHCVRVCGLLVFTTRVYLFNINGGHRAQRVCSDYDCPVRWWFQGNEQIGYNANRFSFSLSAYASKVTKVEECEPSNEGDIGRRLTERDADNGHTYDWTKWSANEVGGICVGIGDSHADMLMYMLKKCATLVRWIKCVRKRSAPMRDRNIWTES